MSIPKRVEARIVNGLKKFKPIIDEARKADRSEADTVTIVRDILAQVLGTTRTATSQVNTRSVGRTVIWPSRSMTSCDFSSKSKRPTEY